jgi:ribosomal-protein-alanine N-acetyltransferase
MDWELLPTINTRRLSLRWISEDDVDAFYAIYSNPEVMRYWSTPPLANRAAASRLVSEIHDGFERRELLKWGIALRTDDTLIGSVTLFHPDFTHRRAEIGYALGRAQWGNGYMQEALQAVFIYAFEVLDLHRIEADVDPRNAASIRTLERLGFQREGYLRERWQVNGEIQDALFYGLLRRDWETATAATNTASLEGYFLGRNSTP